MGRDNDTNERAVLGEALVWTVRERTADPALCATQVLIGRQVQTGLDGSTIEQAIVFATRDRREVGHIRDDRPATILTIKTQQRALCAKAVALDGRLDGGLRPPPFLAILSVARVAKAGHPLMRMHLQDGCSRANDFSSFASGVARSAEGTQTPLWGRSVRRLG